MAVSGNTITIIVVCVSVGIAFWIFACLGGCVWIRRCFGCTTVADEEAQERRDSNRRNRALAIRLGDGTFVPRHHATAGNQIYNPWAAQGMVPEHAVPPVQQGKPGGNDAGGGHYQAGNYAPGRGYPYPVVLGPPAGRHAAGSTGLPATSPPPVYFQGVQGARTEPE